MSWQRGFASTVPEKSGKKSLARRSASARASDVFVLFLGGSNSCRLFPPCGPGRQRREKRPWPAKSKRAPPWKFAAFVCTSTIRSPAECMGKTAFRHTAEFEIPAPHQPPTPPPAELHHSLLHLCQRTTAPLTVLRARWEAEGFETDIFLSTASKSKEKKQLRRRSQPRPCLGPGVLPSIYKHGGRATGSHRIATAPSSRLSVLINIESPHSQAFLAIYRTHHTSLCPGLSHASSIDIDRSPYFRCHKAPSSYISS